MSDLPENFSETRQFEAELTLSRLRGHLELAVENFTALGERISTLRALMEKLQLAIPVKEVGEDLAVLKELEERFRPLSGINEK